MFLTLTLVTLFLHGTLSCPSTVLDNIHKTWNNKPPTGILSKLGGTWTVYKVALPENTEGFKCWMTVVKANESSMTDNVYFKDSKEDFSIQTQIKETQGVIENKYTLDGVDFLDSLYVLYLENGVMGWLLCDEDGESVVGISVEDYATQKDTPETKQAIKDAEDKLKNAGLEIPAVIPTDCPSGQVASDKKV